MALRFCLGRTVIGLRGHVEHPDEESIAVGTDHASVIQDLDDL
jgi:hypothetical protein